jgi:hypothetical protein
MQTILEWIKSLSLAEWLGIAGFILGVLSFALAVFNWLQARHKHQLDTLKPHLVAANDEARDRITLLRNVLNRLEIMKWKIETDQRYTIYDPNSLGPDWDVILDPASDFPPAHKAQIADVHRGLLTYILESHYNLVAVTRGIEKIQGIIDTELQGINKRNKRIAKLNKTHKLSE